uniref:Uncharacterized protein n=1 Tax=Setaria italica TaxID=4555 RepID=K3XTV5_SETIT
MLNQWEEILTLYQYLLRSSFPKFQNCALKNHKFITTHVPTSTNM